MAEGTVPQTFMYEIANSRLVICNINKLIKGVWLGLKVTEYTFTKICIVTAYTFYCLCVRIPIILSCYLTISTLDCLNFANVHKCNYQMFSGEAGLMDHMQ